MPPIQPKDVKDPPLVEEPDIAKINEQIKESWNGQYALVKMPRNCSPMNVIKLYGMAGWKVTDVTGRTEDTTSLRFEKIHYSQDGR